MTIEDFIQTRPCLEELDGFLDALKPGSLPRKMGITLSHDGLTPEVLRAAEDYRKRLLKGKIVPEASLVTRAYDYRFGKPPVKNPLFTGPH